MAREHKNQYCIKHDEFYLPTQDNWAPNFPRNTVLVRVYESRTIRNGSSIYWGRICVWGNDDLGMEKDFDLHETQEARQQQVKNILKEAHSLPNPLNMDWLEFHGFRYS